MIRCSPREGCSDLFGVGVPEALGHSAGSLQLGSWASHFWSSEDGGSSWQPEEFELNSQQRQCSYNIIPSGKHTKNYGKSPFLMGNSTISMVIFNSYVKLAKGNMNCTFQIQEHDKVLGCPVWCLHPILHRKKLHSNQVPANQRCAAPR